MNKYISLIIIFIYCLKYGNISNRQLVTDWFVLTLLANYIQNSFWQLIHGLLHVFTIFIYFCYKMLHISDMTNCQEYRKSIPNQRLYQLGLYDMYMPAVIKTIQIFNNIMSYSQCQRVLSILTQVYGIGKLPHLTFALGIQSRHFHNLIVFYRDLLQLVHTLPYGDGATQNHQTWAIQWENQWFLVPIFQETSI